MGQTGNRLTLEEAAWLAYDEQSDVRNLLDCLPMELRTIVEKYWGIIDKHPMSFRAIGSLLHKDHTTVYYRYREALRIIRKSNRSESVNRQFYST
jgi:hypothetical protein